MITAELITDKIGAYAKEHGLQIVDIRITKFDEITLTIDVIDDEAVGVKVDEAAGVISDETAGVKLNEKQGKRSVSLDDCVLINRKFTEVFDQDEEDYSLVVTSPGVKGDVEIPDVEE